MHPPSPFRTLLTTNTHTYAHKHAGAAEEAVKSAAEGVEATTAEDKAAAAGKPSTPQATEVCVSFVRVFVCVFVCKCMRVCLPVECILATSKRAHSRPLHFFCSYLEALFMLRLCSHLRLSSQDLEALFMLRLCLQFTPLSSLE